MAPPSHPTPPEAPRQAFQPRSFLCSVSRLYEVLTCPNAQTLLAHDVDYDENLVIVLPCKQWSCRYCSSRKIAALAYRTKLAAPNRLLTLTVNPALYETPRDAFDATRRQVPVLYTKLRLRFDEVEYLRVTEVTRLGWPHYHCLVRSPYLPHPVVRDAWTALTGATIVDVRQVKQHFKAYHYLCKYLSKMHHLDWTERHVSYSRRFFPPVPDADSKKRNLARACLIPLHPYNYLRTHYDGQRICQSTPGTFRVDIDMPVPSDGVFLSPDQVAVFYSRTPMAKSEETC